VASPGSSSEIDESLPVVWSTQAQGQGQDNRSTKQQQNIQEIDDVDNV